MPVKHSPAKPDRRHFKPDSDGWEIGCILLAAVVLMVPAWLASPLIRDSFWIDFVWADQFSAALRDGNLYPRWMPESHDGLGAPIFYFYPPLAFYLSGLISLAGVSTYWSVIGAFGVAMVGSGVAMYWWLKRWTRRPLVGALLFMAAPYHIVDFYNRGALAEYCAFGLLPLVAIAIRRAARTGRFGMLALVYTALIMTHLPAALIVSLFFIAPYALFFAAKDRQAFKPLLLGGLFGLGMASIYLLPMMMLQKHVAIDAITMRPDLVAANWSLLTPQHWPNRAGIQLMAWLCGGSLFAAATLLLFRRDIWAISAIAYCIIILGLVPGLWSLPLVEKVQFPWRMLMLAEFAVITAFARARINILPLTVAVLPMLMFSLLILKPDAVAAPQALDHYAARHPDVIEYLPRGAPFSDKGYSDWALDLAKRHHSAQRRGNDQIGTAFYFPAWNVTCDGRAVATRADPATKLLCWRGTNCSARIGLTPAEWLGLALSLLFSSLLIALAKARNQSFGQSGLRLPRLLVISR